MKIALKELFNKRVKEENGDHNEENIHEDYVAKCMGSFGLYQVIVCTIAGLTRFLPMWNLLSIVFLVPKTEFKCREFKIILDEDVKNSTCYDECVEYEFSQKVFRTTLVSQFGLICDKAWLAGFTQTVLMLGVFVGSWLFGWISDRFGRRSAIRIATLYNVISMLASLYSPNYWTFTALRFFVGVSSGGIFVISTVYILEVVGSDHREAAACLAILPDGIAEATLAIFAYYSRTWDIFLMEYGTVSVLIFFVALALPETPRWLVAHGREEKAIKVVTKAAKWNNLDTDHIEEYIKKSIEKTKRVAKMPKPRHHHFHLFDSKDLGVKTMCIVLLFIQAGIGFFGINEYVALLDINIYMSVVLLGLIQVPISLFSVLLNKVFGRRDLIMAVFFTNGLTMVIQIFIPTGHWAAIFFSVIGLSAISIAFAVLYIYITELYPTPLRNMALGVGDSGSKLGAMITPFIVILLPKWVPSLILAVLPFIGVAICFLLPETKGRHLVDAVL